MIDDPDIYAEPLEDTLMAFAAAAVELEGRLFPRFSRGGAQTRLRELCRSGMVRSWIADDELNPIRKIEPGEWRTTELDLRGWVAISVEDLEHWLVVQI